MTKGGAIIIIEDNIDDQFILTEVFRNLEYKNELIFLHDGAEALDFLCSTDIEPFIILCDINIPKIDGIALREKINAGETPKMKCIPYVLYSTAVNPDQVINAYSLSVQGFFRKEYSYKELEKTISILMQYWERCVEC